MSPSGWDFIASASRCFVMSTMRLAVAAEMGCALCDICAVVAWLVVVDERWFMALWHVWRAFLYFRIVWRCLVKVTCCGFLWPLRVVD